MELQQGQPVCIIAGANFVIDGNILLNCPVHQRHLERGIQYIAVTIVDNTVSNSNSDSADFDFAKNGSKGSLSD